MPNRTDAALRWRVGVRFVRIASRPPMAKRIEVSAFVRQLAECREHAIRFRMAPLPCSVCTLDSTNRAPHTAPHLCHSGGKSVDIKSVSSVWPVRTMFSTHSHMTGAYSIIKMMMRLPLSLCVSVYNVIIAEPNFPPFSNALQRSRQSLSMPTATEQRTIATGESVDNATAINLTEHNCQVSAMSQTGARWPDC